MTSRPLLHPYPARPLRVIHVKGNDRQMGRQHAELVGEGVEKGMARFYYDFWKRTLGAFDGVGVNAIKWLLDPFLVSRLAARIPDIVRERIEGVGDVTGIPYAELSTSLVLPDLLPILQAYLVRLQPGKFIEVGMPRFGCSSFVANGENFLYGRNLDFPGVAYWDRYPVIQVTEREGSLRYIGFTSAGVPIAGITGVNEAQISVALHQHYCKETSLRGTLPFVIAEEILSRARTLPEALDILEGASVASSWAFIVTDGKRRDAFVYETHPRARGLRRLVKEKTSVMSHANYYQSAECRPAEYATTARMNWDNYARKSRLEQVVTGFGPGLTPAQAVTCISDHFDPYWGEEKTVNRTVSQVYNIQSLVLDVANMKAWIAVGDSPIQLREYHEYDLGRLFAGESTGTGVVFPAFRFRDEKKAAAKEAYIVSFIQAFDGDFPSALRNVKQSLDIEFGAEAGLVAGVLSLKLGEFGAGKDLLERSRAFLEEKLSRKPVGTAPPPEYFEIGLFLARAHDLLGHRAEATTRYREVAEHPGLEDSNLRALARAAGPYSVKMLSRIVMPYSTYIPFN